MRASPIVLALVLALAACGSSKNSEETPKPPLVVDCEPPPISTAKPPVPCAGICLAHDSCAEAGPSCPAGFVGLPSGCANGAICCVIHDGGTADGGAGAPPDASPDAPQDGSADAPQDG